MKRAVAAVVAAAAAALVAAVLVAVAAARPDAQHVRGGCGPKALTLLFWPQGHPALPGVNFPEFVTPHLEVYRTGSAYPDASFFGYLGADGTFNLRPSCKQVAASTIRARIKPAKVARETTALVCKLPKPVHLDLIQVASGCRLLVIIPPASIAAVASIRQTGSTLTYNAKLCVPTPAPS